MKLNYFYKMSIKPSATSYSSILQYEFENINLKK